MHCEKCGSADTEVTKCAKCGQKSLIRCNNCSYQVCADKYCEVISIKRKIKILTYFAMLLVLFMVLILPIVVMRVMDEQNAPTPTPRPTQVATVAPTKAPPPPPTPEPPSAPDPVVVLKERRNKVASLARKLAADRVGYKKKSSDPRSGGLDFIGLVQHTLAAAGVEVPRNPGAILDLGDRISDRTRLEAGDVMVFSKRANESRPNFLGVYVGEGEFACSWPSGSKAGVLTVDLDHKFWSPRFLFAVRVLGNK